MESKFPGSDVETATADGTILWKPTVKGDHDSLTGMRGSGNSDFILSSPESPDLKGVINKVSSTYHNNLKADVRPERPKIAHDPEDRWVAHTETSDESSVELVAAFSPED